MLINDVNDLICVDCSSDVELIHAHAKDDILEHGLLACSGCGRFYAVIDHVALMFRKSVFKDYLSDGEREKIERLSYTQALDDEMAPDEGHQKQLRAANAWEYQWEVVFPMTREDLDQTEFFGAKGVFWHFLPIDRSLITGARILVGCGGRGREAYHLIRHSPKKIFVVEIGRQIYSMRDVVENADDKLVLIRSDVTYHPVRNNSVDIAICDHALQHVHDHKSAFNSLANSLNEAGNIVICVYSWENNFVMTHLVEPIKPLLQVFPLKVQRLISFVPAAALYLLLKLIYQPLNSALPSLSKKLPLNTHMMFWAKGNFEHVWLSCFDLIHAPISYYFRKEEVLSLAEDNNLQISSLTHPNKVLWSLVASKQANG